MKIKYLGVAALVASSVVGGIFVARKVLRGSSNVPNISVSFKSAFEVQSDCRLWAKEIEKSFKPDAIVFLEKSGFLFAMPLAEEFGCPVYSVSVSRPGDNAKDLIKSKIPYIPKYVLSFALKSKAMYGYSEEKSERFVEAAGLFNDSLPANVERILIVDDSVDTGYSVLAVKELVQDFVPDACIRIASYCVIDYSVDRVTVDYVRKRNEIVVTATSRYSLEYEIFLNELEAWKAGKEMGPKREVYH